MRSGQISPVSWGRFARSAPFFLEHSPASRGTSTSSPTSPLTSRPSHAKASRHLRTALLALAATTGRPRWLWAPADSARPGGELVQRRVALFVEQQQFTQLVLELESIRTRLLELVRQQQQQQRLLGMPAISASSGSCFRVLGTVGLRGIIAFFIVASIISKTMRAGLDWHAGVAEPDEGVAQRRRVRAELERCGHGDPNFSGMLFEDFLYALYAQAYTLRGGGALERLSAYVKPPARAASSLGVREVRVDHRGCDALPLGRRLEAELDTFGSVVEFESNYTESSAAGPEQSYYACERWTLSRAQGVMSRTPDRARVFTCPSCGAPLESMVGGRCQYCQATVDTGQFDWIVEDIANRQPRAARAHVDRHHRREGHRHAHGRRSRRPASASPSSASAIRSSCGQNFKRGWP